MGGRVESSRRRFDFQDRHVVDHIVSGVEGYCIEGGEKDCKREIHRNLFKIRRAMKSRKLFKLV